MSKMVYVYTKSTWREKTQDAYGEESDRLTTYLAPEEAEKMIDLLQNALKAGNQGIRFVAYTGPRTNRNTGEKFFSTCFSVQPKITSTGPLNQAAEDRQQQPRRPASQGQNQPRDRAAGPGPQNSRPKTSNTAQRSQPMSHQSDEDIPF